MSHKDLYSLYLLKAMFCMYTHFLTYIHTLSEIPDMQPCHVTIRQFQHSPASALEADVEIRHTSDSGVFMMAKNLKHLGYLKCHNPTHFQASTGLRIDVKMVHLIPIPTNSLYVF